MWNLSSCHGGPEDPRSTDLPGRGRPGAASVLGNCGWGCAAVSVGLKSRPAATLSPPLLRPGQPALLKKQDTRHSPALCRPPSSPRPPAGRPRQPGCSLGRTHTLSPPASLLPRGEIHSSLSTHDRCLPTGGYLGRDRACLPRAHMGGAPTLTHPRAEAGERASEYRFRPPRVPDTGKQSALRHQ